MDVVPKTFVIIILATKWLERHSSTSVYLKLRDSAKHRAWDQAKFGTVKDFNHRVINYIEDKATQIVYGWIFQVSPSFPGQFERQNSAEIYKYFALV